ncbi:MAG: 7TM-DISM domain-containing protein, partial [Casimicrobiaceae bacterium]
MPSWADVAPFVITPQTRPRGIELEAAERVYQDTTANLTFDDVRRLAPEQFRPLDQLADFPLSSVYWVRVTIRSELPVDMSYVSDVEWWDHQDIYVLHASGEVTHLRSGLLKVPIDANDT